MLPSEARRPMDVGRIRAYYAGLYRRMVAHPTKYRLYGVIEDAIAVLISLGALVDPPNTLRAAWRIVGSVLFALGSVGLALIALSFADEGARAAVGRWKQRRPRPMG